MTPPPRAFSLALKKMTMQVDELDEKFFITAFLKGSQELSTKPYLFRPVTMDKFAPGKKSTSMWRKRLLQREQGIVETTASTTKRGTR